MKFLKTDRLYCFSPPVMIATFAIEIICAVYVVIRYKLTPVTRLAAALLVCLALFQLAEYNVCEGAWGMDSLAWARLGYVAITLLPPLGLHLVMQMTGKYNRLLLGVAYASAAIFAYIFLFVGQGMTSQQCLGNYVIFRVAPWASFPYGIYYYGWLFATIGYALRCARNIAARNVRQALYVLSIGYAAFIVPTTAANLIDPSTRAGIPSIMCGFAVILALLLTGAVLPQYYRKGKGKSKKA